MMNDALYARALRLARNPDDHFLDLAQTLNRILKRDPELFRRLWQEANIGRRRAYYLVTVDEAFRDLPISKARLRKIGWTKLQVIASKVSPANADTLLDMAETLSAKALARAIESESAPEKTHCLVWYLSPAEFDMVVAALAPYGASLEGQTIKGKEEALLKLFADIVEMKGKTK